MKFRFRCTKCGMKIRLEGESVDGVFLCCPCCGGRVFDELETEE